MAEGVTCPKCSCPTGSIAFAKDHGFARAIGCVACGHMWNGTPMERDAARAGDSAWEAEQNADDAAFKAKQERERARAMFEAAGRPVPAWAKEPPRTFKVDASACVETEGELLHNMPTRATPASLLLDASERVTRIARADFHTVREQPWSAEAGANAAEMTKRRGRLALCLVLMSEVEERRVT